jgi:hypothetical protein
MLLFVVIPSGLILAENPVPPVHQIGGRNPPAETAFLFEWPSMQKISPLQQVGLKQSFEEGRFPVSEPECGTYFRLLRLFRGLSRFQRGALRLQP